MKDIDLDDVVALDRNWRKAVRPAWGSDGTIVFMGELDGLRESKKKNNDALKAAKLKYFVQVCFLEE